MDDTPIWYFGYGAMMSKKTLRRRRVSPQAAVPATLPGIGLAFDTPGNSQRGDPTFANLKPHDDASLAPVDVHGVLFLLAPAELRVVDSFEGGYARQLVTARTYDGRSVRAHAYWCDERWPQGLLPSPRYMALLHTGAREHGLSAWWVDVLGHLRAEAQRPHAPPAALPDMEDDDAVRALKDWWWGRLTFSGWPEANVAALRRRFCVGSERELLLFLERAAARAASLRWHDASGAELRFCEAYRHEVCEARDVLARQLTGAVH